MTSVISLWVFDFSSRSRTSAGTQRSSTKGTANEHGALSFEAEQRARALRVHVGDLREFDPLRKTLAGNSVLEHGDVRTGYGPVIRITCDEPSRTVSMRITPVTQRTTVRAGSIREKRLKMNRSKLGGWKSAAFPLPPNTRGCRGH